VRQHSANWLSQGLCDIGFCNLSGSSDEYFVRLTGQIQQDSCLYYFVDRSTRIIAKVDRNTIMKKRGEHSERATTYSPLNYSLLQPLKDHAGRLYGTTLIHRIYM